eukprot:Gb_12158 [translate_table: standard]
MFDFLLRLLAVAATLAAAILMATDNQAISIAMGSVRATYHYSPAFIFFVVANAIACCYSMLSLIHSIINVITSPSRSPFSIFMHFFFDLIIAAMLLAAACAAGTIAYLGIRGNSHA